MSVDDRLSFLLLKDGSYRVYDDTLDGDYVKATHTFLWFYNAKYVEGDKRKEHIFTALVMKDVGYNSYVTRSITDAYWHMKLDITYKTIWHIKQIRMNHTELFGN